MRHCWGGGMVNWRWILLTCPWTNGDGRSKCLWIALFGNLNDSHIGWLQQTCEYQSNSRGQNLICKALHFSGLSLTWVILSESQQSSEILLAAWSDKIVLQTHSSANLSLLTLSAGCQLQVRAQGVLLTKTWAQQEHWNHQVHLYYPHVNNWWIKYSVTSLPGQARDTPYTINYCSISFH